MSEPFSEGTADKLWNYIAHGSLEHRRWLKEAIEAFRLGHPKPPKMES